MVQHLATLSPLLAAKIDVYRVDPAAISEQGGVRWSVLSVGMMYEENVKLKPC